MGKEEFKVPEIKNMDELSLQERILVIANEIRLVKDGKNTYANYQYFKPEQINNKVNPLLLKYKVFPRFYTKFEQRPVEVQITRNGDSETTTTKYETEEIAILELSDILKPDQIVYYSIPIERTEIKGANKMQNIRRHSHVCEEIFIHGSTEY